ncbi:hypothetical protein HDU78_003009 [Chytriomyces hyalinus]|nr:hypothetical protein HDU78_003009 [Chytriomyces hyalinus]
MLIAGLSIFTTHPAILSLDLVDPDAASKVLFRSGPGAARLDGIVMGVSSVARISSAKHRIAVSHPEPYFFTAIKVESESGHSINADALDTYLEDLHRRFTLLHNTFHSHVSLSAASRKLSDLIISLETKLEALFPNLLDSVQLQHLDLLSCFKGPYPLLPSLVLHLKTTSTILHEIQPLFQELFHPTSDSKAYAPPKTKTLLLYCTCLSAGDGGIVGMVKQKGVAVVSSGRGGVPLVKSKSGGGGGDFFPFTGFVVGPEVSSLEESGKGDGWGGAAAVYLNRDGDGFEADDDEDENDGDDQDGIEPPSLNRYRILVYQFKEDMTLAMLVRDNGVPRKVSERQVHELGSYLSEKLGSLYRGLTDALAKTMKDRQAAETRFVCSDSLDGGLYKTNMNLGTLKGAVMSESVVCALESVYSDLNSPGQIPVSEMHLKLDSEVWISGKKSSLAGLNSSRQCCTVTDGASDGVASITSSAAAAVIGTSTAKSLQQTLASKDGAPVNALVALRNAIALKQTGSAMRVFARMDKTEREALKASSSDAANLGLLLLQSPSVSRPHLNNNERDNALTPSNLHALASCLSTSVEAQSAYVAALFGAGRNIEALAAAHSNIKHPIARAVLVKGFARGGMSDVAADMVRAWCKESPETLDFQAAEFAITGLAMVKRVEEAVELFEVVKAVDGYTPSEAVYAGIARGYANEGKISMTNKYLNEYTSKTGKKPTVDSYAALIKAYTVLNQPGDADLVYRDLRLAGLPAPADIYTNLILVHANAGNMQAASRYFHKRSDASANRSANSDPNVIQPRQFKPSKSMHAALISAHAMNGELLVAWRKLASAYDLLGGLKNRSIQGTQMPMSIAKHYLDHPTPVDAIAETVAASGFKKRDFGHMSYSGLLVADGLMAYALQSTTEAPTRSKIFSIVKSIVESVQSTSASPLSSPTQWPLPPSPNPSAQSLARGYEVVRAGLMKSGDRILMTVCREEVDIEQAVKLLDAAEKTNRVSSNLLLRFLETVHRSLNGEQSKITDKDAFRYVQRATKLLEGSGYTTNASFMDVIVRICKSDGNAPCGIIDYTLLEAVQGWAGAGGVASKIANPALRQFMSSNGIKMLVEE